MNAITTKSISVNLPLADVAFFEEFIKKMGWTIEGGSTALGRYLSTRPLEVPLSDDDIMAELSSVRYDK